jgi:GNAT superfamily N-acetyltransferase
MTIEDLSEEHVGTYCKCLEEWSPEMDDEGGHKRQWYEGKKARGLRVKLAKDEGGRIVGMIQYVPAEQAPIIGEGLYYVYCVWVHGHKAGVGDQQHRGIGKALLKAAEEDVRRLGGKGLAAWGVRLPFFMRSSWFKKQGYKRADGDGIVELVFKGFTDDAKPPLLIKQTKKVEGGKDRVRITSFINGWCPAQNIVYERAKRVAEEHKDYVEHVSVRTDEREGLIEYGIVDALFIDGKRVRTGPPPSYDKLKKLVEKRIKARKLAKAQP